MLLTHDIDGWSTEQGLEHAEAIEVATWREVTPPFHSWLAVRLGNGLMTVKFDLRMRLLGSKRWLPLDWHDCRTTHPL